MAKKFEIRNSTAEFLTFVAEGKEQGIQVLYKDETVWATQKAMAQLFDCSADNIGLHLKNIFKSGELVEDSVTEKNSATAADGKNYMTKFYKKVQNKMHYAVHGHTAAELIVERANAEKEHMGLTTWENAPDGKIVKPDVSIAKNYLKQVELEDMGKLVNSVLDLAERMANRHIPMRGNPYFSHSQLIFLPLYPKCGFCQTFNSVNSFGKLAFGKERWLSIHIIVKR